VGLYSGGSRFESFSEQPLIRGFVWVLWVPLDKHIRRLCDTFLLPNLSQFTDYQTHCSPTLPVWQNSKTHTLSIYTYIYITSVVTVSSWLKTVNCDAEVIFVLRISARVSVVLAQVLWFSWIPLIESRDSAAIRRQPIPFKYFQVHHLSIILSFDAI
jgi:hypothetical protein